ncbi:MAG: choice-of-anchor J domain-containing protein, partial [Muribaculaceae bacterium]|nr:choice-of-anchor J domain-containing protein [Muribaculaceae bacterium]
MRKGLTLIACAAVIAGLSNVGWAAPPSAGSARNGSPQKAPDATLPYYNDFDEGESSLDGWTFVNTNKAFTWQWSQYSGYEYTSCLYMSQMPYEGDGTASDNWAFSPAFKLEAGFTYQLKFYITNWFPSDLEVRLTTGTDISNPGTLLYHYEDQDWGDKVITFEVPSTGDYHIAFYDKSPFTENGTALRYQVYIDNLSLMALSNNAVPEAVGSLTQVPGANGEISMSLEWFNPTLSKKGEELDVLTEV